MIGNVIFLAIKLINSKSKTWDIFRKQAIKMGKKKSQDLLKMVFEYMKSMTGNWL